MLEAPCLQVFFLFPHTQVFHSRTLVWGLLDWLGDLMISPSWSCHYRQKDSSTGLSLEQGCGNVALLAFSKISGNITKERILLQYVVYYMYTAVGLLWPLVNHVVLKPDALVQWHIMISINTHTLILSSPKTKSINSNTPFSQPNNTIMVYLLTNSLNRLKYFTFIFLFCNVFK